MKWTSATALIAALSAAAAGTTYVLTRRPVGPAEIVRGVRKDMDSVRFQQRAALLELDEALAAAEGRRDDDLTVEILTTRADVYLQLEDSQRVLEDLERVESMRPGDFALQLRIAGLMASVGDAAGAIEKTKAIITQRPRDAEAYAFLGRLESEAARALLQPTLDQVEEAMTRDQTALISERLINLACRESDDPDLPNAKFELDAAFPVTSRDLFHQALIGVPEARARFVAARAALARSVELDPTADRVLALGESLSAAGQGPLATSLLYAALGVPSLSGSGPIRFELLRLLKDADRLDEALALNRQTNWESVNDFQHVALAARVQYEAGDFALLGRLATQLRALDDLKGNHWLLFYQSAVLVQRTVNRNGELPEVQGSQVRKNLTSFINNVKSFQEPFPGATAEAGYWFAKLAAIRGDTEDEIYGLNVGFSQSGSQTAAGKAQMARALQKRNSVPWLEVELALSDAIDLDPAGSAELVDEWREAGLRNLKSKGMTISNLIADARSINSAVPSARGLGPAVYTLLAEQHLEDGRNYSAIQASNRALKDHPRLIPALDVAISAKVATPNRYKVERDIVRRIEFAGIDASVEESLRQLPRNRLSGDDLITAIKVAPERFGKAAVARWFLENGDSKRAKAALGEMTSTSAPYSMRLLRAQTLFEQQSFKNALEVITSMETSRPLDEDAALLKARVLLELGRRTSIPQVVRQLDAVEASSSTYLQLADLLMGKGEAELALLIIDRLDQDPKTRTPEFYRRRILVDILTSKERGAEFARESIERSEAYLQDGTPEIASILLAVSRRRWTGLPAQIKRLRRSSFKITPQKEVALVLLAERIEAGRRAAQQNLENAPRNATWALIDAAGDAMVKEPISLPAWFGRSANADAEKLLLGSIGRTSRDPREALAMLLIVDRPEWSAWLLPIIDKVGKESGSGIWSNYLRAVALEASGDVRRLNATVDRLVNKHNRFGPAHDWAVELAKAKYPEEPLRPEVVKARRIRLVSLGEALIDDPVEIALAEAGRLANLKRDNASAAERLRVVVGDAGEAAVEAQLILGILKYREEQRFAAAEYLFQAAMGDPGVFQEVVINYLLGCLRSAGAAPTAEGGQGGATGLERAREMLDRLIDRYPLDPMVKLTDLKLSGIPRPGWGEAARGLLNALYKDSGRQPLEALRRGSTRPWVELLLEVRVELAWEIINRDLAHEPGNLELWELRARVAREMDDDDAAAEIYKALMGISPSQEVGYSLAAIMISRGEPEADVLLVLNAADKAGGGGGNRSTLLRSLTGSRHLPLPSPTAPGVPQNQRLTKNRKDKLDGIARALANLWDQRSLQGSGVDEESLGEFYLDVLLQRDVDLLAPEMVAMTSGSSGKLSNGTREALVDPSTRKVLDQLSKGASERPYREATTTALIGLHERAIEEAKGL